VSRSLLLSSITYTSHRKEALRSIIISQRLLGTREIAIFRHTGCGMQTFSTPQLRDIVKNAHPTDAVVAEQVDKIDFDEFSSLEETIETDVRFLKEHPLVLKETKVSGWIYEVETGKVLELFVNQESESHLTPIDKANRIKGVG
jgi:carbonic anhydrase